MLNLCVITGNLGQNPVKSYSSEGNSVANFNLAFKSGKDKTSWIRVSCFSKLAETAEKYLHKGAKITVIGALSEEKWDKNGETKSSFRLIASSIEFIKTNYSESEDTRG